eukprot:Skav232517  [mRNA]  locus=scaffold1096:824214:825064:+ [translate_table: standard]
MAFVKHCGDRLPVKIWKQLCLTSYGADPEKRPWFDRSTWPVVRAKQLIEQQGPLHVDNGLLMGDPGNTQGSTSRRNSWQIKEWKEVPLTFLGVDLTYGEDEGLCDDMGTYIRNLRLPEIGPAGRVNAPAVTKLSFQTTLR